MSELIWALIRQDTNGNRYRVAQYRTREEAETAADSFQSSGNRQLYVVERIEPSPAS